MKTTVLLCAIATTVLGLKDVRAEERVPVDTVLAMMATVPVAPGDPQSAPYRWDRLPGARRIANAIAAVAPDRPWAARMAVYAVHESGLSVVCATGDGGRSLGPWQLQRLLPSMACDPLTAARVWLGRAHRSLADCSALPAAERLAELVSGSCSRGRQLAQWRETLSLRALAGLDGRPQSTTAPPPDAE